MKFTIDNGTYDVAFPSTGSWDKWDTAYIEDVWVDALDFKMQIASTTSDGGPNIDMIAFDMKGVYRTGCKPAKVENDVESSSSGTTIVSVRPAPSLHFDARNQTITTAGGMLMVQVSDAMGKVVAQETHNVASGTVSLLQNQSKMTSGRYFVRVQLNGQVLMSSFLYIK
jgi:hypothetical protein